MAPKRERSLHHERFRFNVRLAESSEILPRFLDGLPGECGRTDRVYDGWGEGNPLRPPRLFPHAQHDAGFVHSGRKQGKRAAHQIGKQLAFSGQRSRGQEARR